MEIQINNPHSDFLEQRVTYRQQQGDGPWDEVSITVWVPYDDDRKVTAAAAKAAARQLLQRAIDSHDAA